MYIFELMRRLALSFWLQNVGASAGDEWRRTPCGRLGGIKPFTELRQGFEKRSSAKESIPILSGVTIDNVHISRCLPAPTSRLAPRPGIFVCRSTVKRFLIDLPTLLESPDLYPLTSAATAYVRLDFIVWPSSLMGYISSIMCEHSGCNKTIMKRLMSTARQY